MQCNNDNKEINSKLNEFTDSRLNVYHWPDMEEWIAIKMNHHKKAKSFIQLTLNQKMAYIRRPGSRPLFDGHSISMCLM